MDSSSPVTFKSVRNIWMARDKPTGAKQRVGEPPEEFKAQREGLAEQEHSGSEQTRKGDAGSETEDSKPQPEQQPGSPKEGPKGEATEVGLPDPTRNQPREEKTKGENTQNADDAVKEQHAVASPVSETAPKSWGSVSLPEISESACSSEDGDRSLSSPGSDGPIRRATDVFVQPDAGLSPREDENGSPVGENQAQKSQGQVRSPAEAPVNPPHYPPPPHIHVEENQAQKRREQEVQSPAEAPKDPGIKPELIWADDLETAKPASRKSTGSPPPAEKDSRDVDKLGDVASPANKPLPPPRSSLVTTVETSYHQQVVQGFHKRISELTAELNNLKTDRDIQQLVNLPPADSTKVLAEMQHQLIEKDKRLRTLERENGDYKRNQMIQAVELQELSDHCQGLEKQVSSLNKHVFPSLPPLQSVRETLGEDDEDADLARTAKLANAALRSAEEEIAALKKGEHKRQQLEMLLDHAKLKIASLQQGTTHRQSSSPSQVSQMWEETRLQSDGSAEVLRRQLDLSRGEITELKSRISELQRKNDVAQAVVEETRALLAQTQTAAGPQRPWQQPLAAVLQETLSRASQTEPEYAPLFRKSAEPSPAAEQQQREAMAALEKKIAGMVAEVEEVGSLAGRGLEVLRVMEECLAHVDPLVSVLGQRADLNSLLHAIATRTQAVLTGTSEAGRSKAKTESHTPSSPAVGSETAGRESESLIPRVRELERSERFLKEELDAASAALAKATAQNRAFSIELGILRNQLEGVTSRSPAQGGEESLQARVQQLEREKEQLIECLEDLNRTKKEEESVEGADSDTVQSLRKEKQTLEATLVELRHLKDTMQGESQEARLHVLHLQRDNGELKSALEGLEREVSAKDQSIRNLTEQVQDARAKMAEGHEELVMRRKEINSLSKKLSAVSAALEAVNAESIQGGSLYSTRDHGSPSSVASEGPAAELAAAREEIKALHEKMIEYKKQHEQSEGPSAELTAAQEEIKALHEKMIEYKKQHEQSVSAIAASEQLREHLSSLKQEVEALRKKRAEQEKLIERTNHPPEESQQELSKAREELATLKEKMVEMEKQMKLKQQKLAVLAEYKMQMAKQNGELIKDA